MKVSASILVVTWCSLAFAQTQPATRGQEAPPPPAHRNDPATVSAVMRSNGGSLFRATLATAPDPNAARPVAVSLFAVAPPEPRTIRKHDQITIIIREESEYSSDSNSELTKDYRLDARISEFIDLGELFKEGRLKGGGVSDPIPSINLSGNRDFQGEAKIDRQDSFVARIQAEVVDVKPNGTCVVQARKRIVTDEEEQEFILTGSLRAADVTVDNTVLSTQVANLELQKKHKGAVRDNTKRGLIPKLLDVINPF